MLPSAPPPPQLEQGQEAVFPHSLESAGSAQCLPHGGSAGSSHVVAGAVSALSMQQLSFGNCCGGKVGGGELDGDASRWMEDDVCSDSGSDVRIKPHQSSMDCPSLTQ